MAGVTGPTAAGFTEDPPLCECILGVAGAAMRKKHSAAGAKPAALMLKPKSG
jgi:hypothetical protein